MKKFFIFALVFAIVVLIAAYAGYRWSKSELSEAASINGELVVEIPQNASVSESISIMNESGLLKPSWFYDFLAKFYARFNSRGVKAGLYRFKSGSTNEEILKAIFDGTHQNIVSVTYPEGVTVERIAEISAANFNFTKEEFLELANSRKTRKQWEIKASSLEGFLFPSSYEFYADASADDVLNKLIRTQEKLWNEKFEDLAERRGMTRLEVLTLASIIEAETSVDKERPIVSGVYHNRLERGMLLQADPTVQYALKGKKRLTYSDLKTNNQYNTYKYPGLPPGPINCPSEASIEAALKPAEHKYLFFVAKGDGSGEHYFSSTNKQHQRYVSKYRRNRKQNE